MPVQGLTVGEVGVHVILQFGLVFVGYLLAVRFLVNLVVDFIVLLHLPLHGVTRGKFRELDVQKVAIGYLLVIFGSLFSLFDNYVGIFSEELVEL